MIVCKKDVRPQDQREQDLVDLIRQSDLEAWRRRNELRKGSATSRHRNKKAYRRKKKYNNPED